MVSNYINQLLLELATGNALEHSYRPALKNLFESLDQTIRAVNEPSRSKFGAPDFAFYKVTNSNLVLGYVETKDLKINLDNIEKSEQLKRYYGYANLILTNYLDFRFFRNGVKYQTVSIAKTHNSVIVPIEENYLQLERELKAFLEGKPETITNAKRLAEIMGGKAARVRDNVISYLKLDQGKNEELLRIYKVMQELLVQDLTIENFADMYAQTLVYGLFVARYYDETPENFTRQEARDLVPASNPFLQHFFDHIVGPKFDKRLTFIVDELCDVFSVSAIQEIIAKHYNLFGEVVDKDPIIHFYEDFLKEYDPNLRKKMGAYYTPVAVVHFIIRAVDDVLKNEFHLSNGLADTSKIERQFMQQGTKAKEVLHKVQILDPAVGTATFLNETVKFVYQKFKGQEGVWKSYVENELLPRIHGFELMMAPYTIAHLKLAMTLKETGIDHFEKRLGIYLTNTLEEGIKAQQTLFGIGFGESIADESRQAAEIKSNRPIMVIIGNPPYSVSSSNKGEWILNLIKDYKKDLNERKINLDDDYIKFIRFTEYMIDKNKNGIVAMITNNSFIDGITHRQMRRHLLETFDEIYVLDLHGSSMKKEKAPDGGKDENVFNIQQGVVVTIFVKKGGKKKNIAKVYHNEFYGRRIEKFEKLHSSSFRHMNWNIVDASHPYYFFVPKGLKEKGEYYKGIKIDDVFSIYSSGIETQKDSIAIHFELSDIKNVINNFTTLQQIELESKYNLGSRSKAKLKEAVSDITSSEGEYVQVLYRPFDKRWTYYTGNAVGFMARPRDEVMSNFVKHKNIGLQLCRQQSTFDFQHVLVSDALVDRNSISMQTRESTYFFPLYQYSKDGNKTSNFKQEIVAKLEKIVGKCSSEDLFDYIYVVLHSPWYRETYKELLKIDFPRIPYPKDKKTFLSLATLGRRLRKLHLMEDSGIENFATSYSVPGENLVERAEYRGENVYINELQYFGKVPKEVWEFYIGGYQPAQKWLKDRRGRKLTYEDIIHYQKIIFLLLKTKEIMRLIDEKLNL